ncbi:hypothetical protein [Saccharopolyspora hordei]|uniref:Uncharacterized protein n=1 Tax=Saccharopolyspora hordei TaxID=1838 RepID=A0A853AKF9_9PSEU|nr:hypothetical protein [Saccharopolyspora hordei]NYI84518.1 hypothetical protein [Saccharopolyspora hordei]
MTKTRSPQRNLAGVPRTTTVPTAVAPERPSRWWDRPSLVLSVVFSVVQVWALVVVLVSVQPEGAVRVALACVMAAAVLAVMSAWGRART